MSNPHDDMHPTTTLVTERLLLQPATLADADIIWPHVSNPEISRHMSWEPHVDMAQTRAFLISIEEAAAAGRSHTWTIRDRSTKELCGIFSLIAILRTHRSLSYHRAELAYWCVPSWQGKGIMTEAGHAVIDHAFSQLGLNRLVVAHHLENPASQRLIQRLGFSQIGVEHQAFQKNGQWIDTIIYELLKDWHLTSRSNLLPQ